MITIVTLLAGRFYALEAYFWGLSIIDYPKEQINLVFLTNSDSTDYIYLLENRIKNLEGYANKQLFKTTIVPPSANAFIEKGRHTSEHASTIAKLYNEAYQHIHTEDFLLLEDDIIAPSNAITGLLKCYNEDVGYVCGVQMDRHHHQMFMWDLATTRVYPEGDSCDSVQYAAATIRRPYGIREIGLGHFGLTLLKRSVCDEIGTPVFKPNSPLCGALVGCDMVFCLELKKKKICNFDVRGLHMDSLGRIH